ncbi:MAG: 4'-phosphopantetheinyl transferase superfamily protein [Deltaproteobacteria bacterium]|nr:4'-phosphopantetheinyl transferase superfamily protein [Deltaproteobacteria bacterium]
MITKRGDLTDGLQGFLASVGVTIDPQLYDEHLWQKLGICFPSSLKTACRKRKAEYLAGRYCIRQSMEQAGFVPGSPFSIRSGKHREPLWPEGWTGSVTHSHQLAMAAVAPRHLCRSLGLDLEKRLSEKSFAAIRHAVLFNSEPGLLESVRGEGESAVRSCATLIFSAKESIFKAIFPHVGIYFGFEDANITAIDWQRKTFSFRLTRTLGPDFQDGYTGDGTFRMLNPEPDDEENLFVRTCVVIFQVGDDTGYLW